MKCFAVVVGGFLAVESITPTAKAALIAYEGFDYENSGSSALLGKSGGTGWPGAWIDGGGTAGNAGFTVSQDDVSLDSATYPFEPIGDRALAAGTGVSGSSNSMRISRILPSTFDMGVEGGVLYASFLMQKTGGASTTAGGNNRSSR
jgi:hypothetical protein